MYKTTKEPSPTRHPTFGVQGFPPCPESSNACVERGFRPMDKPFSRHPILGCPSYIRIRRIYILHYSLRS